MVWGLWGVVTIQDGACDGNLPVWVVWGDRAKHPEIRTVPVNLQPGGARFRYTLARPADLASPP